MLICLEQDPVTNGNVEDTMTTGGEKTPNRYHSLDILLKSILSTFAA